MLESFLENYNLAEEEQESVSKILKKRHLLRPNYHGKDRRIIIISNIGIPSGWKDAIDIKIIQHGGSKLLKKLRKI